VKDNLEGFILKKSTSLLLSGILVSGMVLGTIVTPATVHAAGETAATDAKAEDKKVTNTISFVDSTGKAVTETTASATGVEGSAITGVKAPDNFAFIDGETPVLGKEGATVKVRVTPIVDITVNYVDQNGDTVKTDNNKIEAGDRNSLKLTNLPVGYRWNNEEEQTITVVSGQTYNIPVTKQISNTIIFKTADNVEEGKTTIVGDKVGDTVKLSSAQQPNEGYSTDGKDLILQNDKNTQTILVTKDAATDVNGVVTVKGEIGHLYTKGSKLITGRSLASGTRWQTRTKANLKGVDYYLVGGNEWIKANDVSYKANETDTDTGDNTVPDDSSVQKTDKRIVETKVLSVLRDDENNPIENRGLDKNTRWKTDQMRTIKGVKMYHVGTGEWLLASDIK